MASGLIGVATKMERAAEHLTNLVDEIDQFVASAHTVVSREHDAGSPAGWWLRVEWSDPIPPRFGAIVGDILTNTRAALDHLAWQLVLTFGGTPTRKTSFPIISTPRGTPVGIRGGAAIPEEVLAVVARVQPYSNGSLGELAAFHPLHVLNLLVNTDKHSSLTVVEMFGENSDLKVMSLDGSITFARAETRGGASGDRFAWLPVDAFPDNQPWEFVAEVEPIVAIDVGERAMHPIVDLLREIHQYVQRSVIAPIALLTPAFGPEQP